MSDTNWVLPSSNNLIPESSGLQNIGSLSNPWNTIYVENIIPAVSGTEGFITKLNGLSGVVIITGAGINTVTTAGQVITVSGSSYALPSNVVFGPTGTSINAFATWGNTSGTQLLNNSLFVSGNTIYDSSSDNITLSNGAISATAASGNTVLGLAPNNLEFYTINEELGYGGLELEPDSYQSLFLYSAGGQFLAGNLANAFVANAIFKSGIGTIVSDMNAQNGGAAGGADYLLLQSGTAILSDIGNDTIVMNSGIALTTSGIATVNGRQIITSGIGLGNVTVTESNGTLTVSGSTFSLPSNVVISGTSTELSVLNVLVLTGTVGVFNTLTGTTINATNITGTNIYGTTVYQGNVEVLTTGIGLGTVTTSVLNGIITISGSSYALPSNVVISGTSTELTILNFNSMSGTNAVITNITGIIINTTNLTGTLATITTINATNFTGTNISGTTGILSTLNAFKSITTPLITPTTVVATNITGTNISGTTLKAQNATIGIFNFTSETGTIANITTITGTNAIFTNITGTDIYQGNNQVLNTVTGLGTISVVSTINGFVTISGASTALPSNVVISGTSTELTILNFNSVTGTNAVITNITGTVINATNFTGTNVIANTLLSGNSLIISNSLVVSATPNNTGTFNTFAGNGAGVSNTYGTENTAFGVDALNANTSGNYNAAFGVGALQSNTGGVQNVAVGAGALQNNGMGNYNIGLGQNALVSNTSGIANMAMGSAALALNTYGNYNSAIGVSALKSNTVGINNIAIGANAMLNSVSGNNNTAIGYSSLAAASGSLNVGIGYNATLNSPWDSNEIIIGAALMGSGSNTVAIGNANITNNYFNGNVSANSYSGTQYNGNVSGTATVGSVAIPFSGLFGTAYVGTHTTTGSYTATLQDTWIFTNQSASITITLPVTPAGKVFNVLSTVSSLTNTVKITGNGTTINGAASITLNSATVGSTAMLISNGPSYYQVGNII